MTQNTNVLITGANRGIGEGLLAAFLARPNITLVAAVRDPASSTFQCLTNGLTRGKNTELIVVKIDSTSETDPQAAVSVLKSEYQISQLDIVIANAGIARYTQMAGVVPISEVIDHHRINTIGPLVLFQAVEPLLRASTASPRFIVMSSSLGSIASIDLMPQNSTAYGSSKAATNYMTRKIHQEYEYLIAFPLHPGWVQTEMGNTGARNAGLEKADVTVEDSVKGLMVKIYEATRENSGGKFVTFDNSDLAW